MFIVPIQPIGGLDALQQLQSVRNVTQKDDSQNGDFRSLVMDAVQNTRETGQAMNTEIEKLATGETDSLTDSIVASMKYSASVDLMVSLRNKALDAYNELMRINV